MEADRVWRAIQNAYFENRLIFVSCILFLFGKLFPGYYCHWLISTSQEGHFATRFTIFHPLDVEWPIIVYHAYCTTWSRF